MKITSVEPVTLTVPLPPEAPIRWSGGIIRAAHIALVRVRTDEGHEGLGEVYAGLWVPEVVAALVRHYEQLLVGREADDITGLWQRMYASSLFWGKTGIALATIGAIETALWDAVGKARGVPVYKLLGGAAHERLRVYASAGLERPLDELAAEMRGYVAQGFTAVKVRVGLGPARDRPKIAAVRAALGAEMELMVDAVQGHNPEPWTAADAIRTARAIEEFDIAWLEEPCANTDWDGYADVRRAVRIPVAGGESSTGIHEYARFIEKRAVDILQPDAAHSGGIRECIRIATLAHEAGIRVVPHVWGAGVGMMANYHFALATPGCTLVEYPTWGLPLRDELLDNAFTLHEGHLTLANRPGLGVILTPETEARYAYKPGLGVEMRRMT